MSKLLSFFLSFIYFFIASTAFALNSNEPAYVIAGKITEKKYQEYSKTIEDFESKILEKINQYAPKLKKSFLEKPKIKEHPAGYQVLPKIIASKSTKSNSHKNESYAYSWPIVQDMIRRELERLSDIQMKLNSLHKLSEREQENILIGIIDDFELIKKNKSLIEHHIQHNWFWQREIHLDPKRFYELSILHDLTVRLFKLEEELKTKPNSPIILGQIKDIKQKIKEATLYKLEVPNFIKLEGKILKVPVVTDIANDSFIKKVKNIIESKWQNKKLKIKLEIQKIPTKMLYLSKGRESDVPKPGDKIDIEKHILLFPKNKAIFTTGGLTTYSVPRYYLVFGPQDITENVVAHEFGHILGFIDGYFRGAKNLNENGYEIREIVPDPDDLMNNPDTGKLNDEHFEVLLNKLKKNS